MKYRQQRVDLHGFLAMEIPAHELSPDLRQQLRHALLSGQGLRDVAARALRELQAKGLLRPAGTLRRGADRIALHALAGSPRVYDLRSLLEDMTEIPPAPAPAAPEGATEQEVGQSQSGDAWASVAGVRALLRRDWVSFGLEASLGDLLAEFRGKLGDGGLQLLLWEGSIPGDFEDSELEVELVPEHGPIARRALEAERSAAAAGERFRQRQWFAVKAQDQCVGALGLAPQVDRELGREAAAAVGDLIAAFLRSQLRVYSDALTGVHNRGFFEHQFSVELERSRRAELALAVLFADLDHFKRVNDDYGHDVGDQVLRHAAQLFVSHLRRIDYVFRWGGEEFAILLPATDLSEARHTAERLRQTLASTPVSLEDGRAVDVSVSIGLALFPHHGKSERELLRLCDQALYEAKRGGRNRVCVVGEYARAEAEEN